MINYSRNTGAAIIAALGLAAAGAASAGTTILSQTFGDSRTFTSGNFEGGSLGSTSGPTSLMFAAFTPPSLSNVSSVEVVWTFKETFVGNGGPAGGGISLHVDPVPAFINGSIYDGSAPADGGGGGGANQDFTGGLGPLGLDDTFTPASPGGYFAALTGPNPFSIDWDVVSNRYLVFPSANGTLTALGSLEIIYTTGVPEPATWALMLVGFGGLGGVLRSRRQSAPTAA